MIYERWVGRRLIHRARESSVLLIPAVIEGLTPVGAVFALPDGDGAVDDGVSALLSPSLVFACLWCCEELLTSLSALRFGRFFIPSMSLAALCDAIWVVVVQRPFRVWAGVEAVSGGFCG